RRNNASRPLARAEQQGIGDRAAIMASVSKDFYAFGPFRVDLRTGVLWKDGAQVPLTPKASELLLVLVERGEAGITKAELLERLWPDTVVLENNLTVTMSALRKALGETAAAPRYIQTLPRRGYRFVPTALDAAPASAPEHPPVSVGRPRPRRDDSGPSTERTPHAGPFVGRQAELEFLEERLTAAARGRGRVVCITGEAGIGKTGLSERFLARAAESDHRPRIARGRCLETFGSGEAYWPFLEALDALLAGTDGEDARRVVRGFAPTWCLQFPGVFGEGDVLRELQRETAGATRERMLREFVDALGVLSRERPLVLLLEDLHWADPSSIDLLRLLSQRSCTQAWLILGTFRPVEAALRNAPLERFRQELVVREIDELSLSPLGGAEIQSYIDARFRSRDLPEELSHVLLTRTEGHPLFLTRLVSLFVERGEISETPEGWKLTRPLRDVELSLPADLHGTIERQLDLLEPHARRLLAYASIEGEEFSSLVLAALLDQDALEVEERLEPLCRVHRLIDLVGEERWPNGQASVRYRFAHALYQNVLYDSLVSRRRALLHQRAAESLLAHFGAHAAEVAVPLSVHFERGGDAQRALEFATMAGHNAHRLLAYSEAKEHFGRALALLGAATTPEIAVAAARLHLARGWVDFDAGAHDLGEADFARCRERAREAASPEIECEALFATSVIHSFSYRFETSANFDRELLRVAEANGNVEWIAQAYLGLASGCANCGEFEAALRWNRKAERLVRPDFSPRVRASLHTNLGTCQLFGSNYAEALRHFESSIELWAGISGVVSVECHQTLGRVYGNLGRLSAGLRAFRFAEELARRNGQGFRWEQLPSGIGWLLSEIGDFDAAVRADEEAVRRSAEHGAALSEASHRADLARTHLELGAFAECRSELERARAVLQEPGIAACPCDVLWTGLRLLSIESALAGAQDDAQGSQRIAEELRDSAKRLGSPKYVAVAEQRLASLYRRRGDLEGARQALHRALGILGAHPVPILTWRVQADLGALEAASGNAGRALSAYRAARSIVDTIAAELDSPDLRATFIGSPPVRAVFASTVA
ncbi:MAG TPA: AAA family ATPase, partial [Polyangiaceae bacterium]|nr:AAA family ATPase [Polyangiaceae bacterium]